MTKTERTATFSLASIFAFRMLGLFMILPVFSLYAHTLPDATPTLIGIALGIYGLTQACLQIPFGLLSDKFGRKRMIIIGMIIFSIGSVIAALSTSITGVIIGRAIQGAGAVGSVIIALVADLTHEQHRTKAMAVIGMTIGTAFTVAMIVGPLLNAYIGVPGIFWFTACLAVLSMGIVKFIVPTPHHLHIQRDAETVPALLKNILRNSELLRLDFSIFCLHAVLTAVFIVVPIILQNQADVAEPQQWRIYLPALLAAFAATIPVIIFAEKKRQMKATLIGAIIVLLLVQIALCTVTPNMWLLGIILFVFFTAFTCLEAILPSLISKIAPAGSKGTAVGVYSTSQFFGIFIGGSMGGWLYSLHHFNGVFIFCATLILLWLLLAITMKPPPYLATFIVNIGKIDRSAALALKQKFLMQPGVAEALVSPEEGVAYLKIDSEIANKSQLENIKLG